MRVRRVVDVVRPDEDLREDEHHEPHPEDVGDLPRRREPRRPGQRLEQRRPHQHPEGDERARAGARGSRRSEAPRRTAPARARRQKLTAQSGSATSGCASTRSRWTTRNAQQRPQQPPVEAEHEQQRADVAEQQVLEHVHREQPLLADRVDRRLERDEERQQAGRERREPRRAAPVGRGAPASAPAASRARRRARARRSRADRSSSRSSRGHGFSPTRRRVPVFRIGYGSGDEAAQGTRGGCAAPAVRCSRVAAARRTRSTRTATPRPTSRISSG